MSWIERVEAQPGFMNGFEPYPLQRPAGGEHVDLRRMTLVTQSIELPSGELRLLQPDEAAELPDTGGSSGRRLLRTGRCCGAAAWRSRASSTVCRSTGCGWSSSAAGWPCRASPPHAPAQPCSPRIGCLDALKLVARNADANGVQVETAAIDWAEPEELISRVPFDLVLAADVLYERPSVALMLSLLPQLAPRAWLADPGRPAADAFLEEARRRRWAVETQVRGVVQIHRLQLD